MAGEKYGPTESGLAAALTALGSTPDAVATTLANGGYRGQPGDPCGCPVAAYLVAVTGRVADVRPEFSALQVDTTGHGHIVWGVEVNTPEPVREFVDAFDHGMWPELAVES